MNVKHWALFIVVTLSVNYVSATLPFLGFLGGSQTTRSRGGVRSYSGWNRCNERMHDYFSESIESVKHVVKSEYGGECSLKETREDNYELKRISAKGFGDFTFGDTCQYYVHDGQAYIRLGIGFEKIIAEFELGAEEAVGGLIGRFVKSLFGIFGGLVGRLLQIVFPSFLCDIIVVGDYTNGFRLHDFRVLKPEGKIGFLGDLADHGDSLGSYSSLILKPLYFAINLFFGQHIRPIWSTEVGNWECNRDLFKRWGVNLGARRGYGVKQIGGGSDDVESDIGESDVGASGEEDGGVEGSGGLGLAGVTGGRRSGGGSVRGRQSGRSGYNGRRRHGGRHGGYGSGGRSRHGGKRGGYGYGGRSRHGGKRGGYGSGGRSVHGRNTGGRKSGGRSVYGQKYGGQRYNGGSRYGGASDGGYESDEELGYGGASDGGYESEEELGYGGASDGEYESDEKSGYGEGKGTGYRTEESESYESGDGGYSSGYRYSYGNDGNEEDEEDDE